MKAKVKILGIGNRKEGVSKKGNPYDFLPVAIGFPAEGYNGLYVETVNMDMSVYPKEQPLQVGQERTVYLHHQNFRIVIDDFV